MVTNLSDANMVNYYIFNLRWQTLLVYTRMDFSNGCNGM